MFFLTLGNYSPIHLVTYYLMTACYVKPTVLEMETVNYKVTVFCPTEIKKNYSKIVIYFFSF